MDKNKVLVGVVVVVMLALGMTFPRGNTVVERVVEFAGAGPIFSFPVELQNGVIEGGVVASSTTSATGTLLSSAIENATTLNYTLNLVDSTLTFPASSTIGFMRNVGDAKVFYVRNATTTAAMDLTFAAGTGLNYKKATSTKVLIGDTDGGNFAKVTLIRQSDSDIDMLVDLYLD